MRLFILYLITTFIAIYVSWSGIKPLKIKKNSKILLILLTFIIAYRFQIMALISNGKLFIPNAPSFIIFSSAWAFCAIGLLCFLLILKDVGLIIYLLYLAFKRKAKIRNLQGKLNKLTLIFLLFSMFFASIGLYLGVKRPRLRQHFVTCKNMPESIDNLKVLVLADLHINSTTRTADIEYIVNKCNMLEPDMVFIVGDFVDGSVKSIGKKVAILGNLKARYGLFGVSGNHETLSGYNEWIDKLNSMNIKMLENDSVSILDDRVTIVGATLNPDKEEPDIAKIVANTPKNSFKILLAHQPAIALLAKGQGIDLQLSGHTHGGMIFGLNYIIKYCNAGYVSGLYDINDMKLFVTNGTAIWNGFPIRFMVTSDIDYLILKR